jgi:ABC-type dipeptide/oligopeptide/nickel transport system permease subunit
MFDVVLLALISGLFLGFILAEIKTFKAYQRVWRVLALLPALALVIVICSIVIGILRDRTSHNLWPLEIVLWSTGGLVYLGVLHLVRKITSPRRVP